MGIFLNGLITSGLFPGEFISLANLRGYYPFNGNANDLSGNGLNLTEVGSPTYSAGTFSQAISLNGTTQYAEISDASYDWNGQTSYSIGAWVYIDSFAFESTSQLIGKNNNGETGFAIQVSNSGATEVVQLSCQFSPVGGNNISINSPASIIGVWSHLVATRSVTGIATLYLNGVQVGVDDTGNVPFGNTAKPFLVGANKLGASPSLFLDGLVDDAFIFHRELNPQEVLAIYSSNNPLKT